MSARRNKEKPIIELEIEAIGFEGVAIARKENLVYFVKHAVPGDIVKVRALRKRSNHVQTQLLEVIRPSELRIDPICRHYGVCGGCSWQNLTYSQQLQWKTQHVKDAFDRIGKIEYKKLLPILGSPKQFNYRNKMEFSFGASRWLEEFEINSIDEIESKNFALGLHIPGRYDKILSIDKCHLHLELCNQILDAVRNKSISLNLSAYHQRLHTGFLRNLVFRTSDEYSQLMTILITKSPEIEDENELIEWLFNDFQKEFPQITTIIHAVNDTVSPVAKGEISEIIGTPYITERVMDVDFRISPFSFFQTNSGQLSQFIGRILETAELNENHIVWDLYCGTGSITLPAARKVRKITGIELVESSIIDAKQNTQLNDINYAEFICSDLHTKDIPELLNKLEKPDLVFIDPPRAGMHKNLINHLLTLSIPRMVYVSCNPATQARDCSLLSEKYELSSLQPVDMFPQTYHVENIALLNLKEYI